jgi:hypothetical protein
MNTTLAVALVIPWIFWGIFMGLLIAAGRSWINILVFPAGITVVILAVTILSSVREAFWASLILHLFLLFYFLKSYVSLVHRERKKKG